MLILLTTKAAAARVRSMTTTGSVTCRLSDFREWVDPDPAAPEQLAPTVPMALRMAMNYQRDRPAFLAANVIPDGLRTLPDPYPVMMHDLDRVEVRPLPTVPGRLGVDFAVAVALAQLAVSQKLAAAGRHDHAAYFLESAGLSAGCVCSQQSADILDAMFQAFEDGPESVPWPDGILWPDGVGEWLQGFGIDLDAGG
jgi:hypothetical protein